MIHVPVWFPLVVFTTKGVETVSFPSAVKFCNLMRAPGIVIIFGKEIWMLLWFPGSISMTIKSSSTIGKVAFGLGVPPGTDGHVLAGKDSVIAEEGPVFVQSKL
jgi:hypothetical protein